MSVAELKVEELVASLEQRIAALEKQVAALTAAAPAAPAYAQKTEPAPVFVPPPPEDELTPEILSVISAAICAFLGKSARIRRVRRIHSTGMNPWAQQGRVFIQGSHNLPTHRQ